MRALLLSVIRGYQRWLSPLLGTRCRFHPSCSRYMADAVQRFGTAPGVLLGGFRLLRCHPFNAGGFDAVPERFPLKFWARSPDRSPPGSESRSAIASDVACCNHQE